MSYEKHRLKNKAKTPNSSISITELTYRIGKNNKEYDTNFTVRSAYGQYELWDNNSGTRIDSGSKKDIYDTFIRIRFQEKYRAKPYVDMRWHNEDIIGVYLPVNKSDAQQVFEEYIKNTDYAISPNLWYIHSKQTVTPELKDSQSIPQHIPDGWTYVEFWRKVK